MSPRVRTFPVITEGDIRVSRRAPAPVAKCAGCGSLIWLAQNPDLDEAVLRHDGARCETWERQGQLLVLRTAAVPR